MKVESIANTLKRRSSADQLLSLEEVITKVTNVPICHLMDFPWNSSLASFVSNQWFLKPHESKCYYKITSVTKVILSSISLHLTQQRLRNFDITFPCLCVYRLLHCYLLISLLTTRVTVSYTCNRGTIWVWEE